MPLRCLAVPWFNVDGVKGIYLRSLKDMLSCGTGLQCANLKDSDVLTRGFASHILGFISSWQHAEINLFRESESCSVVSDSLQHHGLYRPWNSPGQNTGMGSFSLLQGIFPTHGSNSGLPHCRRILYQLSHIGYILFWESSAGSKEYLEPIYFL